MNEGAIAISEMSQQVGGGACAEACVVLAGGIRLSALATEAHCPVLDLWLGRQGTVLEHWLANLASASAPGAPVRVVHDGKHSAPCAPGRASGLEVAIVSEPRAYRGPAGILRDVCADLDPEATVLVGDAARWLSAPPTDLLATHAQRRALVTVGVNPDGTPAGLYAIRAKALEHVPRNGFMDIKEQWLARLAGNGAGVWAHRLSGAGTLPLRTREQFLEASRLAGGGASEASARCVWGRACASGAWRSVAPEAHVDASALIVESVVMPGAEVGAGAAVVQSILCPQARVEAGEVLRAQVRLGRGRGRMGAQRENPPAGGTDR